jgi:uncharacterized protein (DUF1697 family)
MATRIALLRGINVGGHAKVAMADLRRMFEDLGFDSVRTLLQSGNVVFESTRKGDLERLLEAEATKRLKLGIDFFVRTPREWDAVIAGNPFSAEARRDPGHLIAMILKGKPRAADIAALRAMIVGRERLEAAGSVLYIVYPDGMGTSRFTSNRIESKLATRGTARNWNTVLKLAELARA